jgi:hypothetical protein
VINIEGEKKVLGIVVGLIFIIIVILAVLISLNEKTMTTSGKAKYAGNEQQVILPANDQATQGTPSTATGSERPAPRPPVRDSTTTTISWPSEEETSEPRVIIVSPMQVQEGYERARNIVLSSQCYAMVGDVREISYMTGLVGTKFIANIVPNDDFSVFSVIIAVKLSDGKHPVYYQEFPVTVDLTTNKIVECKGRPVTMEDVIGVPQ